MKKILLSAITILLLSACARENIPFSSGALEGIPTPAPVDWSSVAKTEIIQFESNAADPYSVNLWIVGDQSKVYIYAGDNETRWVENLSRDPNGKLQAAGKLYDVTATRVTDEAEFAAFAEAWDTKYGSDRPRSAKASETWLYRLSGR